MYYSSSLLKKYINIQDKAQNIADNLTLKSCEIEEVIQRKIPKDIVIGKVTNVEKHPDADKLLVCQVDCGDKGQYQIITGGENVTSDYFVPVALPGCYLPELDLEIATRKMKGLESSGMICSKNELGIKEDTDKHWIWLMQDIKGNEGDFDDIQEEDKGKAITDKFIWMDNEIFDVDNKTLTNRPELTGHFGLSIELNSIYKNLESSYVKYDKISEYINKFNDTNIFELFQNSNQPSTKINAQTDSLRTYTLLEINNVSVTNSNFITRLSLLDLGLNPKNNWVDFSNIFMFLTSQPIHFFDADKVQGNITIREAQDGEQFVDLFGETHNLVEGDILICDDKKILALAGVVGGQDSGVDENTQNIILEIANFDPIKVRRTATRVGLRTDSQTRFEKNISPAFSLYSLILFLEELEFYKKDLGNYEIGGLDYHINSSFSDHDLGLNKKVDIDISQASTFIFGEDKPGFETQAVSILEKLGFEVKDGYVSVPIWRSPDDINIKEDVYEEIIRVYGYENVNKKPIMKPAEYIPFTDDVKINRNIESTLVEELSFDQVTTYPWIEEKLVNLYKVNKENLYTLKNPLSSEMPYLRNSLFYNMMEIIEKNFRFYDNINIFDIGKIWDKSWDETEKESLCLFSYARSVSNWQEDIVLQMKGVLSKLFENLNIQGEIVYENTDSEFFHPKKQGRILINGKHIGNIGQLNPFYYDHYKLPLNCAVAYSEVFIADIKEFIKEEYGISYLDYETLQDQIVYRDLSIVIDKDKQYGDITKTINEIPEINDIDIFDLYSGENIPEGKKSISLTMKITGDGNYTTEDINSVMDKAIEKVQQAGGRLRE